MWRPSPSFLSNTSRTSMDGQIQPLQAGLRVGNFCPRIFGGKSWLQGRQRVVGFFYKTKNVSTKIPGSRCQSRKGGEKQNWIQYFFWEMFMPNTWGFMIQIWHTIFFRWVEITNYRNGFGPRRPKKQFHQVGRRRIRTFNWSNFDVQGLVSVDFY